MPRLQRPLARLALALLLTAGCSAGSFALPEGTVVTGRWHAARLALTLDATGGVAEYDCAHGALRAPLVLDAHGRFDVIGVHVREHGGPIGEGESADTRAARYVGRFGSGVLTLRVVVDADTLGPFLLRRDAAVQLVKCL